MIYNVKVSEDELASFLRSITTYTGRAAVRKFLESAGLVWNNYWNLPVGDCRKYFIRACFWADLFPTARQLELLFKNEKLIGPINTVLSMCNSVWWARRNEWTPLITQAFSNMSVEEFLVLAKRGVIMTIVECAPKNFLPLLIGHKRLHGMAQAELAKRLKG